MADNKKLRFYGLCLILLVFSVNNARVARVQIDAFAPEASQRKETVPAMFVFGDSLLDIGNNNNFLISFAKANHLPYDIDFCAGLTGRFSNGYIIVDAIDLVLLGCIPSILSQGNKDICSEEVNKLVHPFNINTKTMINNLTSNLPDALFAYIDIHNIMQNIVANVGSYGFNIVNRGCCETGRNRGQLTCSPFQTPCPDRNQYIFWDAYYPTEAANVLLGQSF